MRSLSPPTDPVPDGYRASHYHYDGVGYELTPKDRAYYYEGEPIRSTGRTREAAMLPRRVQDNRGGHRNYYEFERAGYGTTDGSIAPETEYEVRTSVGNVAPLRRTSCVRDSRHSV